MNQPATPFHDAEVEGRYARMIPGFHVEKTRSKATVVSIRQGTQAGRNAFRRHLQAIWLKKMARSSKRRKVLILGAGKIGRAIADTLAMGGEVDVCGFLDDRQVGAPGVLGRVADLEWMARAEFIDEVIVTLPSQSTSAVQACAVAQRNHLDIRAAVELPSGRWPNAEVARIGEVPMISLHRELFPRAMLVLKRLIDVAGGLTGLVLFAPLMAVLALLIRLDSAGPALYASQRVGTRGRLFRCFKFRSMVQNADRMQEMLRYRNQRLGPTFKLDDDPRVTRVGRFLRRYSLDEIPQLWNVLRGEMSLVGPRPHPIEDVSRYELHEYRRLDMKPGITGLWQVTARKNPSFELNMYLDLTYIENWTLLLDLRILLCTFRALVSPEGV